MAAAEDGFEVFVEGRGAALRRTAYWLTGDWQLGEDLVQTALTKTYGRLNQIRDPAATESYVRQVMITTWRAWWRRRWRQEVPTAALPEPGDPRDAVGGVAEQHWLAGLLAKLPRQQRLALVLRYYEDLSEAETARLMGCTAGSVKTHTSRGLARLRELWPEHMENGAPVTSAEGGP
jgi:RNA polymerase sigma-70 factor (sigma-E family)